MTQNPLEVVACIIAREDEFLITQRLKTSHLGHLWEFPGGKLEPGETLEQCAIRECREEIGVEVKPIGLFKTLQHDYPEISVKLYFMRCDLVAGEPQALECADWAWVKAEDLRNYSFPEADREIIEALEKMEMGSAMRSNPTS